MIKFLTKILLTCTLLLLILYGLGSVIASHWLRGDLTDKVDYMRKHSDEYNTIVVGSSLIARHFDPRIFNEKNNQSLTSYNVGMDGMFFLESEFITEKIIQDKILPNLQNVIFLVAKPHKYNKRNFRTTRNRYYLNWSRLWFVCRYYYDDIESMQLYMASFSEKFLCMGEIKPFLEKLFSDKKKNNYSHQRKMMLSDRHGFFPYDKKKKPKVKKQKLKKRKNTKWQVIEEANLKERLLLKRFEALTQIDTSINFYFLHLPESPYWKIMDTDKFNNIVLRYPDNFPEYYDEQYQQDGLKHLNAAGATVFTERLTAVFNQLHE